MEHSWWWGSTSPRISDKGISNIRTIIEDDVWIGSNAVVRKGLHIGRGAVIGAGSVVLMDVEPYTIVVGMPAKVIKKRIPDEIIEQITATEFWLYPPPKAKELLLKIDFSNCAIPDYLDTP
jgi:NDP-sugar pyrophosphorylase family protein